jgi:pimeloyl-ACP methyl ester carboxylesterase
VQRDGVEAVADETLERLVGGRRAAPEVTQLLRRMILDTSVEGMVGALAGMAARPDSTPFLPKIACPTLVVVGQDDAITPPEKAHAMKSAISGAELVEIQDAGHLAPLEQPAAVNAAIRSFLPRVLSARPRSSPFRPA